MKTKPKTYIETSIVGSLTAQPSRDIVVAAHRVVTWEWWAERSAFDLYASQLVLHEAAAGDADAASDRLVALDDATLLEVTEEAILLAEKLSPGRGVPAEARVDALHVATATVHGMDYLLTWDCKRIANAALRRRIEGICRAEGLDPPIICTPLELSRE